MAERKIHPRRAEWSLVRKTALLGDVVDEPTFTTMLGINARQMRRFLSEGEVYGIDFPLSIAQPEGQKKLWLKYEAEAFAQKFKGARAARHPNGIDYANRKKPRRG